MSILDLSFASGALRERTRQLSKRYAGCEPQQAVDRVIAMLLSGVGQNTTSFPDEKYCAKIDDMKSKERATTHKLKDKLLTETMAVLMVTGNAGVMPHTFLQPVRTIPATIAAELGESPHGGIHYQALFVLGCVLFVMTLLINLGVEYVSSKRKFSHGGATNRRNHQFFIKAVAVPGPRACLHDRRHLGRTTHRPH